MASCHKCKSKIKGETGIECVGVSKKVFHEAFKCSGVDQSTISMLCANSNIKYICNDCIQYIQNVNLVLQNMEQAVNKNNEYLKEYKEDFETAIKHNEKEVMDLLKAIEVNYLKRLEEIKIVQ